MKIFGFVFSLLLASAAAVGAPARPLRFHQAPLIDVARALCVRFHVRIRLEAKPSLPISVDFSGMDVHQALEAVAAQAGLAVAPLGKAEKDGYALRPNGPGKPAGNASLADAKPANPDEARAALLKKREELLRRAAVLQAAASASR